jgi:hypothetical protein
VIYSSAASFASKLGLPSFAWARQRTRPKKGDEHDVYSVSAMVAQGCLSRDSPALEEAA